MDLENLLTLSLSVSLSLLLLDQHFVLASSFDLLNVKYVGWGMDFPRSPVKIKLNDVQATRNLGKHDDKVKEILSTVVKTFIHLWLLNTDVKEEP